MIKAPYNFVPLATKVVFPEWASEVSIDRPFQDGISGTIEVLYTAQTPVFIGNGEGNNNLINNYRAANGQYAIPGSTLRGMVRNIIEIVSFGKFNRVSDATFSVRDLTPAAKELYRNHFVQKRINGGWLVFEDKSWVLYPIDYHRVEDREVEHCFKLKSGILKSRNVAVDRIKHLGGSPQIYFLKGTNKVSKIERKSFPSSTGGYVVLTGNPGGKKHLDFIFTNKGKNKITIEYETILAFKQAHAPDAQNQKRGLDLVEKLKEYDRFGYPGIPVFYLSDQNGKPTSLGLSMMYRLPYKNTLHDAIKKSSEKNFSDAMDFAECIFGKIENIKNKTSSTMNVSLRGRVQFEDAPAQCESLENQVGTILGNPKPTYYPTYIEQNASNRTYKTLMDNDVRLRGWKRYPVKNTPNPISVGAGQQNMASYFQPLQKGTVFNGRIHFHNLKKEELGVLLWAITWGNNKELSHAVGMGKPYGFGQIKAEISSLTYLYNDSCDNLYTVSSIEERNDWIKSFTDYMESKVGEWKSCNQLQELKAMANPKNAKRNGWDLTHMSLSTKEFINAKRSFRYLAPYSSSEQSSCINKGHNASGRYNARKSGGTGQKVPQPVSSNRISEIANGVPMKKNKKKEDGKCCKR